MFKTTSESVVLWGKVHKKLHLPFQEVKALLWKILAYSKYVGKKKEKKTKISKFSATRTYLKLKIFSFFFLFYFWTFP